MNTLRLIFSQGILFLKRQPRDWSVTVARTSIDRFVYQMVFPYLSLYIVALGATATQLGIVNSIGMIIAGIFGPLTGWFIDRTGPKRVYLVGIGFLAICYLTYAIAHDWTITIIAMIAYWMGFSVSIHSCATICGNCLVNKDRATGMMICETVAAGLLGMAGPILGAWLVTNSGGVNTEGIRPLFLVALVFTIGTLVLVFTQLSDKRWRIATGVVPNLLSDLHQVMRQGRYLKRWMVIAVFTHLPLAMVFPFSQVFAHEFKGAEEYVLGMMVTGSALASIVFAIPLGRLADRVGRKKALYITIPLFWIANLLLVWAPSPVFLIIAGILQGFYFIGGPISAAMERELVPPEQMGRWLGILRLFRMLVAGCLVFVSGIIWDKLGPQYVFFIFVGLDIILRLPLLISMPETLKLKLGGQNQITS
jgi:MFS family permease